MKIVRAILLGAAISSPLLIPACAKKDDVKEVINVKTKEALDLERNALQKDEKKLAAQLFSWTSHLSDIGFDLSVIVPRKNREDDRQNAAYVDLTLRIQDFRNTSGTKFFYTKPENKAIDTYFNMIKAGESFAPYTKKYIDMEDKDFTTFVEKTMKRIPDIAEDELEDWKRISTERLKKYREAISKVSETRAGFITKTEAFNKDAELSQQSIYEPTYGLTLERLRLLKLK